MEKIVKYSSAPWKWYVEDYKRVRLKGLDGVPIITVSLCAGCEEAARRDQELKIDFTWGRCGTPTLENSKLLETALELYEALKNEVFGVDTPCVQIGRAHV